MPLRNSVRCDSETSVVSSKSRAWSFRRLTMWSFMAVYTLVAYHLPRCKVQVVPLEGEIYFNDDLHWRAAGPEVQSLHRSANSGAVISATNRTSLLPGRGSVRCSRNGPLRARDRSTQPG